MASVDRQTPAERKAQEATMRVGLEQPHRRGTDNPYDPRHEDAVWREVTRLRLRDELAFAGLEFGQMGRAYRVALGLGVRGVPNGLAIEMTEEQRAAKDK